MSQRPGPKPTPKPIPKPTPKPQPKPQPRPYPGPVIEIPRPQNPPIDFPPYDRPIPRGEPVPIPSQPRTPSGEVIIRYLPDGTPVTAEGGGVVGPRSNYDLAMAQQTYNNLMQQQMANAAAQGTQLAPTPQPQATTSASRQNQQAMQNYQNLVGQGMANMQAIGTPNSIGGFGKPQPQQRKISTPGFQSPRPFG